MIGTVAQDTRIIQFPSKKKAPRKTGPNKNRWGSVRSINGKLYVDFVYLDERVREKTGLDDNRQNIKKVRDQLDKINIAIKERAFRFSDVFPKSKKKEYFAGKERTFYGYKKTPSEINFKEYAKQWYSRLKESGRVGQRTLYGYKTYIDSYLNPFFEKKSFGDLNLAVFDEFIGWARNQHFKGKSISHETVNKIFVPLKMICKSATNEFMWFSYNPFFGFKKLQEGDAYERIIPFTIDEQKILIKKMADHWKPYFQFAFCSGLRQGEQIGLKPDDIDWEKKILHVRRAITKDEEGKTMEGPTKNKFSRRSIRLTPVMCNVLCSQRPIYEKFKGEYFFCSPEGNMVHPPNVLRRVWIPALKAAELPYREMKQTRHSFATVALSYGESPLWVAKVMGHRDTNMIIKVYSKYVEDASGSKDGTLINAAYQCAIGKEE
ncbi:MAG: DUF3596 domain-containing protein [Smithella sp.]|nr:DUF3596 domain-containing protein [Smithella sp.]